MTGLTLMSATPVGVGGAVSVRFWRLGQGDECAPWSLGDSEWRFVVYQSKLPLLVVICSISINRC